MSESSRALNVAIIGAGPAGMYAAAALLEHGAGGGQFDIRVDVFDRLPTPFGLVRGGVAPDHLDKKRVARVFEETAFQKGFRFFGAVEIGRDLGLDELRGWYDAVILAYGAETGRRAEIENAGLSGCAVAGDFVRWFNGHPDFSEQRFDLSHRRALVVGNGNVALDVARIMTLQTSALERSDIAPHALEALRDSPTQEIWVVGRRGPDSAAFNNPELLELGRLEQVDVVVEASEEELESAVRATQAQAHSQLHSRQDSWETRRKLETLLEYRRRPRRYDRSIHLAFNLEPTAVLGETRCDGVRFRRKTAAEEANASLDIEAGFVLFSIGFQGAPLAGAPFDPGKRIVPTVRGRVTGTDHPGLYATGWIARGPQGVIGANKICARRCVAALLEDALDGRLQDGRMEGPAHADLEKELTRRGLRAVSFGDWQTIDQTEQDAGAGAGRPRVKLCTRPALLAAAFGAG